MKIFLIKMEETKMSTKLTIVLNEVAKANKFVNETVKFESDIDIISGRYICDAKSLLAIFSYDLSKPVNVEIHSDNEEEIRRFNEVMEEFK